MLICQALGNVTQDSFICYSFANDQEALLFTDNFALPNSE